LNPTADSVNEPLASVPKYEVWTDGCGRGAWRRRENAFEATGRAVSASTVAQVSTRMKATLTCAQTLALSPRGCGDAHVGRFGQAGYFH